MFYLISSERFVTGLFSRSLLPLKVRRVSKKINDRQTRAQLDISKPTISFTKEVCKIEKSSHSCSLQPNGVKPDHLDGFID